MVDSKIQAPSNAPLDPDPSEWLNQRLEKLFRDLHSACSTLAVAGLLPKVVTLWVRQELAIEAPLSTEQKENIISTLVPVFIEKYDYESLGLLKDEVPVKVCVAPACEAWAEAMWGHRLETLFLQSKDKLDSASCRVLQVSDKGLAMELFYRIKAGEQTFETLASQYSEGKERFNGGLIPLCSLSSMPLGLGKLLPDLDIGELLPPSRVGNKIVLVQLVESKPARFDSRNCKTLLNIELDKWLKTVEQLALSHLRYDKR